jgi:hypothetical protein
MELRPTIQIQSILKAMTDVVLPAVDPENKLAQEQARLVIGMLHLLAQRLPLIYRYDRDELSRCLALAHALRQQVQDIPRASESARHLAASVAAGENVLDRAKAEPGELEAAIFDLREKVGAMIQTANAAATASQLQGMKSVVLAAAKEQLIRERAWLSMQGWEPDPKKVPSIECLIGGGI